MVTFISLFLKHQEIQRPKKTLYPFWDKRLTESFQPELNRRPLPYHGSALPLSYGSLAPQVGFEPTTDRLTANCSTTELLWNMRLATSYSRRENPTTIGAEELNFCVRYGNRCDLFAIAAKPVDIIIIP